MPTKRLHWTSFLGDCSKGFIYSDLVDFIGAEIDEYKTTTRLHSQVAHSAAHHYAMRQWVQGTDSLRGSEQIGFLFNVSQLLLHPIMSKSSRKKARCWDSCLFLSSADKASLLG
jgi:hypothetical protein